MTVLVSGFSCLKKPKTDLFLLYVNVVFLQKQHFYSYFLKTKHSASRYARIELLIITMFMKSQLNVGNAIGNMLLCDVIKMTLFEILSKRNQIPASLSLSCWSGFSIPETMSLYSDKLTVLNIPLRSS